MIARFLGQYWPFLVIAALAGFAFWQMDKASDAEALADSRQETIAGLRSDIKGFVGSIELQNAAIASLSERREEGRVIYLQDYARADTRAQSHDQRAAQLMALQSEFTDELAECRAAKTLLQQELVE